MSNSEYTILVVDDNQMNVDMLSRRLQRDDYKVIEAFNGREAVQCLQDNSVDLVLLDVMMPVMDGLGVLGVMQGEDELQDIPVIMVTAKNERDCIDRCLEWGAVDYIIKPINMVKLRASIQTYLK